jgi:hypothetical protein
MCSFFHFNDKPFNMSILTKRIYNTILSCNNGNWSSNAVIDAIKACKQLARKSQSEVLPKQFHELRDELTTRTGPLDLIQKMLSHPPVQKLARSDVMILHTLCTYKPVASTQTALDVIKLFESKRNLHRQQEELSAIFVALRNAVNRKEFEQAFEIVDLCSSKRISTTIGDLGERSQITGLIGLLLLATSGLLQFGGIFPLVGYWGGLVSIGMKWLSPQPGYESGFKVGWRPEVHIRDRIKRHQELVMVNRIVIGYRELVDVNVSNFHIHHNRSPRPDIELVLNEQIKQRNMRIMSIQEEIMYQDYWATAGEGLEWVEPDQDPVTMLAKTPDMFIEAKDTTS